MAEHSHPDPDAQIYTTATEFAILAGTPLTPDGEHMAPNDGSLGQTEDIGAVGATAARRVLEIGQFEHPESRASEQVAQERAAQEGWLERRGLLEDAPRLTMTRQEFEVLRNVGLGDGGSVTSHLIEQTRRNYGIPQGAQYASVDLVPDDPNLPHTTELVALQEEDFGTTVDEGRLESLGIKPEDIAHLTMTEQELRLFETAGLGGGASLIKHVRDIYGIQDPKDPRNDQYAPQYALIDVKSDDPNLPNEPLLVVISEQDFGTIIDRETIDKDRKYLTDDLDPDSPRTPGTYHTVDIRRALTDAYYDLQTFARGLMDGKTKNPLEGREFWLRAGGVTFVDRDGIERVQKDAYVWENGRALASAVELTINSPGQYNSVCAVVGERRDPGNGKTAIMAQIIDPEVVLTIEGENLKRLQDVYRDLYHEPNFALTSEQRASRDEIFNDYLVSFTSEAAMDNQADESRSRSEDQAPRYRYRR